MIVKGIVSAIKGDFVDVILPEYDDIVITASKVYRKDMVIEKCLCPSCTGGYGCEEEIVKKLKVNDFVLVIVFNGDFNDCIII